MLAYIIFILISAILLALAEIQIEGKAGWARELPTWRKSISIGKFKIGITGYHLFFFSAIFFLLHFRFVFEPFSFKDELINIASYMLIMTFEDFFWFVFNPHYGLEKFDKEHVYWFKSWFLGLPSFYFIVIPTALIILNFASSL